MTDTSVDSVPMVDFLPLLSGADPYPGYASLRQAGGVHVATKPNGSRVWLITRYEDVRAVLADERFAMNAANSREGYRGFDLPPELDSHLLNRDGADHARLRRVASQAFTPQRVEALGPRIQAMADRLLEAVAPAGHTDLVSTYAEPLPITVICGLLGIPDEAGQAMRVLTTEIMWGRPSRPRRQIVADMRDLLVSVIADKRTQPGEDLLTVMLEAEGNGELDADELTSLVFLTVWGAYENTANLIGNVTLALLEQPEQYAAIAGQPDPHTADMQRATEELLRHAGPMLVAIRRFPTQDVTVSGVTIRAGDTVLLALGSANRDPERFTNPDRLDLSRDNNAHVSFAAGAHYCLGAPLGRLEIRIALWTLLHRLPDLRLAVPTDQLRWRTDYRQRALVELPVAYTPVPHREAR